MKKVPSYFRFSIRDFCNPKSKIQNLKSTIYIVFFLIVCSVLYSVGLADDETKKRPVYIINPGDQLLITVFGHEEELISLVVVRPDGMITYPVVGDVKAAELSIAQLSAVIREKLLGYYEDPQVTVQLKESTLGIVYIFGDVKEPGQKKFPRPVNVFEALAAAGQVEKTADLVNAKIIKKGKEVIPVDLEKLLKEDIIKQGIVSGEFLSDKFMLEDGDVLLIPSAVNINVIGQVSEPGQYPASTPINLIHALALAGGTLEITADLKHVRIIRIDGSVDVIDITRAWSGAGKSQNPDDTKTENLTNPAYHQMIQPGDIVVVPEKGKVSVLGNVKNQGQFAVDDKISILEALALAGVDEDANLEKLRIIRSTGERITVDASRIWQQNVPLTDVGLSPGDTLIVPSVFKINWNAISVSLLVFSTLYAMFIKK